MTFIGDNDWKPEYPVIGWRNGVFVREGKNYIRDVPLTKRVCKQCGSTFIRAEFPKKLKNNIDNSFGKKLCMNCIYAIMVIDFSKFAMIDQRAMRRAINQELFEIGEQKRDAL